MLSIGTAAASSGAELPTSATPIRVLVRGVDIAPPAATKKELDQAKKDAAESIESVERALNKQHGKASTRWPAEAVESYVQARCRAQAAASAAAFAGLEQKDLDESRAHVEERLNELARKGAVAIATSSEDAHLVCEVAGRHTTFAGLLRSNYTVALRIAAGGQYRLTHSQSSASRRGEGSSLDGRRPPLSLRASVLDRRRNRQFGACRPRPLVEPCEEAR